MDTALPLGYVLAWVPRCFQNAAHFGTVMIGNNVEGPLDVRGAKIHSRGLFMADEMRILSDYVILCCPELIWVARPTQKAADTVSWSLHF